MRKLFIMAAAVSLAMTACNEFDIPSGTVDPPSIPETPDTPVEGDLPVATLSDFTLQSSQLLADGTFRLAFEVSGTVENVSEDLQWGVAYRFAEDAEWANLDATVGAEAQTLSFEGVLPAALLDETWNLTVYYRPFVVVDEVEVDGATLTVTAPWTPVLTTGEAHDVTEDAAVVTGHAEGFDFSGDGTGAALVVVYAPSPDFTIATAQGIVEIADATPGDQEAALSGLLEATTYHYRFAFRVGDRYYFSQGEATLTTETSNEAVDLGLPSGLKWAAYNVGANSPEEFGGYYAWGETSEKSSYDLSNYAYTIFDGETVGGYVDIGDEISGTQYDVARQKWGGAWRLPTASEAQELIANCTMLRDTINGVAGVRALGSNGNSIFLPSAGWQYGTDISYVQDRGFYLTGTIGSSGGSGSRASVLRTITRRSEMYFSNVDFRYYGMSVRPVKE